MPVLLKGAKDELVDAAVNKQIIRRKVCACNKVTCQPLKFLTKLTSKLVFRNLPCDPTYKDSRG